MQRASAAADGQGVGWQPINACATFKSRPCLRYKSRALFARQRRHLSDQAVVNFPQVGYCVLINHVGKPNVNSLLHDIILRQLTERTLIVENSRLWRCSEG